MRRLYILLKNEREYIITFFLPLTNGGLLERGYGIQFVRSCDFESVDKI